MKRRDLSLTVALCASLTAHALIVRVAADRYSRDLDWLLFFKPASAVQLALETASPSTAPAEDPRTAPLQILNSDFGDAAGTGIGSNAVEAEGPRRALEGDEEQAQLSRNPGRPQTNEQASVADSREGDAGVGGAPADAADLAPPIALLTPHEPKAEDPLEAPGSVPELLVPRTATHAPDRSIALQTAGSVVGDQDRKGVISQNPPPPESASDDSKSHSVPPTLLADASDQAGPMAAIPAAKPPRPPSPAAARSDAAGDGRRPGSNGKPAQPGLLNESDSDAFSKDGGLEIRNGRLVPRFGRKVKTVKPRLMLSGQLALFQQRTVIVKVSIDTTGKVTSVDVYRSCGSADVDQPTRAAVYDWWFEPSRDAAGKAIPDVLIFPIVWR